MDEVVGIPVYMNGQPYGFASTEGKKLIVDLEPDVIKQLKELTRVGLLCGIHLKPRYVEANPWVADR